MPDFKKPVARTAKVKPPFAAPEAPRTTTADTAPAVAPVLASAPVALVAPEARTVEPAPPAPVLPAPASTPTLAAPAAVADVSTALDKGTEMMATTADAAAQTSDKVQTLIADAQTRARDTMEKGSRAYEEMGSFAKGNVEAMIASSRVAASGFEALGQDVADYGKRSFEQATTAFKSFATVKSPTELFQLQSDFARSAFDGMVAEGSKISEKMLKLAGDVAQPLSSRFAMAAEKMKVGL